MKPPKLRWEFTLDSRAGCWAMTLLGLAFIFVPLGNVISPPTYYQVTDIRANPVFWLGVAALFATFGVVLIYRAIKGSPFGEGKN